jgi:MFS family permease
MLDSFDVMLYALVLSPLMKDLGLTKTSAGLIGSTTLVAAAAGGIVFGVVADRYGRVTALRWSILLYAIFTAACGLAHNFWQLLGFRVLLGFGMGGEWASGAALVSESWPREHRGKALGLMQSAWAVGYALAAITTAIVLPIGGWRLVFFVGLLPALLTIWTRRNVSESESWRLTKQNSAPQLGRLSTLFRKRLLGLTIAVTLMNGCALFAWWGFNLWMPAYLSLPASQGGLKLSSSTTAMLIVTMQIGMWFGYVTFGAISDLVGRKLSYIVYLLAAAASLLAYSLARSPVALLGLGPIVAFFGTGHFSGFGTGTSEIYETRIRATAQGFTYNVGRLASAAAPFVLGSWTETHGFAAAFRLTAIFLVVAAVFWIWIPETRGRPEQSEI